MNLNKFPAIKIFLTSISIPVASWILVHIFAIFGFFVAISYPFWWLLSPDRIQCLLCRVKQKNSKCLFCGEKARRGPLKFRSVVFNSILILILSGLSLTAVYIESKVVNNFLITSTPTVNFVIPDKGQKQVGEVFPMEVKLTGMKFPINAIQADIKFDPQVLNLVEISTSNSFANIFVQKEINNQYGYARLSGGLANPGFSDTSGLFAEFYFKAISPGAAKVSFLPSSMVLLNNGKGTNVLKDLASTSYLVVPNDEPISNSDDVLNLVDSSDVLGEEDGEDSQLIFFDQKENNPSQVLGESSDENTKKDSLFTKLSKALLKIDEGVLKFWEGVGNFKF